MREHLFLWLGWVAVLGVGCATRSVPAVPPPTVLAPAPVQAATAPAEPPEPRGGLRLKVVPSDALVRVDARPWGAVSAIGDGSGVLVLDPGVHRICLARKGYQTWRGEVTVGERTELLEVQLEKTR